MHIYMCIYVDTLTLRDGGGGTEQLPGGRRTAVFVIYIYIDIYIDIEIEIYLDLDR